MASGTPWASSPVQPLRFVSHLIHLLAEAALGVLALLLVAVCVLAWRLAQGPIDLTWLMRREHALVAIPGAQFTLGGADLAWEGFSTNNQPLIVRLRDVALSLPNHGPTLRVAQARVRFAESQLLLGRLTPRSVSLSGAELSMRREADGSVRLGLPPSPAEETPAFWPVQLSQLSVQGGTVIVHDDAFGLDWRASDVALAVSRPVEAGLSGQGRATLQAGGVRALLTVQAVAAAGSTQVTAALTPVNLASLARLSSQLGPLASVDAPVAADLTAVLNTNLRPTEGSLNLMAGPGTVRAGQGAVHLASASASLAGASVRTPPRTFPAGVGAFGHANGRPGRHRQRQGNPHRRPCACRAQRGRRRSGNGGPTPNLGRREQAAEHAPG